VYDGLLRMPFRSLNLTFIQEYVIERERERERERVLKLERKKFRENVKIEKWKKRP
jgi:hypothetical protein